MIPIRVIIVCGKDRIVDDKQRREENRWVWWINIMRVIIISSITHTKILFSSFLSPLEPACSMPGITRQPQTKTIPYQWGIT